MENAAQKPKPIITVSHAVNWYLGNYLLAPHNALRDEEGRNEDICEVMEKLKVELGERKMTHKEFLELVKANGIHSKYYRYRRAEPPDCPLCRYLGRKY